MKIKINYGQSKKTSFYDKYISSEMTYDWVTLDSPESILNDFADFLIILRYVFSFYV